jgi:PAS domain S-box-containing protein
MALDDSRLSMNTADFKLEFFLGRSAISLWQKAVCLAVAYFACAEASNFLSVRDTAFVYLWMPDGLFVAALLLSTRRDWPWLVLAILPANSLFELLHGTKLADIPFFYFANAAQAVAGAWLVRHFVKPWPTLSTLRGFLGFLIFAAVLSPMLGAIIGAATLMMSGLSFSFWQSWRLWWGANAMAVLILSPFILAWFTNSEVNRQSLKQQKKVLEAVLLALVFIALIWHLLFIEHGVMSSNKGQIVLPLLWAGLRFGLRAVTSVNLLLALILAFFTTQLHAGLTSAQIASGEYVFILQFSLVMAALLGLIPAIILRERERAIGELRESEERFRNLTQAAFEGISISENGRILDANDQMVKMFGYERDELIGKEIINLAAPESFSIVAEAIRENRELIYGHKLLRKNGSSFYAEAQAKIVRVGNRTLRMTAVRDITERKLAEEALRESEAKRIKANHREQRARAKYTRQLIASQEAERTRIATELHDGLGQNLLLIKNRAELALGKENQTTDWRGQMEGISDLASQTIAEVRQISHDLHPPQLDHLGLTRALEAMIDNTAQASEIAFGHKLDFVDDIFSKDAAMNLYRIVQENLNNILKHSRAKKARIKLERDVHEVQLQITDDGCGFEMNETGDNPKGLGLKNIVERVKMLGGKLKINSQPGKGTHVEVTVPFSESK